MGALRDVDIPSDDIGVDDVTFIFEKLMAKVRENLERELPVEEFMLAVDILTGFHMAITAIRPVARPSTMSAPSDLTSASSIYGISIPVLLDIGLKVALIAGIGFALFAVGSQLLVVLLLIAYFFVDLSKSRLSRLQSPEQIDAHPDYCHHDVRVATDPLLKQASDSMGRLDSAFRKYLAVMQDKRSSTQNRSVPSDRLRESLAAFQQMLGAARRNHPQLASIVESQTLAAIEEAGMRAISHSVDASDEDLFDVQLDVSKRLSVPVEMYPAITNHKGTIQLRGRLVLPNK